MKLLIAIHLDGNDLEEMDFETFLKEARDATAIHIEVGRPIEEAEGNVARMCMLSASNFVVQVER